MSDAEIDAPPASTIEDAMRDAVISMHRTGNGDDLTVNHVRTAAEEALDLPKGFLKNDQWKKKSHNLIAKIFEEHCGAESAPSPKKAAKPKPKAKPKAKPKSETKKGAKATNDTTSRGVKRKAAAPAKKPHKRRKAASSDEDSDAAMSDPPMEDDEPSDAESEPPANPARRQKKVVAEDSEQEDETARKGIPKTEDQDSESDEATKAAPLAKDPLQRATTPPAVKDDMSESELSSVIDESPVRKKRQKKEPVPKRAKEPKGAKVKARVTKPKKVEDDPDQAEIKRLQGWLVKCGIRKVWGKELAKCDTPKDKIRHLKGMLKDAGMDGKYSVEKAAHIKEQREFAKDLEEIKAGAMAWGEEEATNTGRPRRRATRPVQQAVVLEDEDDEDGDEGKAPDGKDDETEEDDDEVKGLSGSEDTVDEGSEDEDSD